MTKTTKAFNLELPSHPGVQYDFTNAELEEAKNGTVYYKTFNANPGKAFCALIVSFLWIVALERPSFKLNRKECNKLADDMRVKCLTRVDEHTLWHLRQIPRTGCPGPLLNSGNGSNLWATLQVLKGRNFEVSLTRNDEQMLVLTSDASFDELIEQLDRVTNDAIQKPEIRTGYTVAIEKYAAKKLNQLGQHSDPLMHRLILLSKFAANFRLNINDVSRVGDNRSIHLNLLRMQAKVKN